MVVLFLSFMLFIVCAPSESKHKEEFQNKIYKVLQNDHVFTQDELDLIPADETIVLTKYARDQFKTTKTDAEKMNDQGNDQGEDIDESQDFEDDYEPVEFSDNKDNDDYENFEDDLENDYNY